MLLADALQCVIDDYTVKNSTSITTTKLKTRKHLLRIFDGCQDIDTITTAQILVYARTRKNEDAANSSINRELAILSRAYSLNGFLWKKPGVRQWMKLKETPPRRVFVTEDEAVGLIRALPEDLALLVQFIWLTGCRISEARELQWSEIVYERNEICIAGRRCKNGEERVIRLTRDLRTVLLRVIRRHPVYVFTRPNKKPVRNFYKAWHRACRQAGIAGHRVPHDMRRSMARRIVRAGIDRHTGRMLLGHKTEVMFTRYQIEEREDIHNAWERLHR